MSLNHTYRHFFIIALVAAVFCLLFMFCANPITPSGGPKDQTPPKLDSVSSSQNEQTKFVKQNLFFGFDEWVVVRNPFQQVVISPPLITLPEIKTKGKGVEVIFDKDEEFLENTTYTINFGESIQDLNEGNALENFTFVFSTGDVIDSLFVEGRIVDTREKKPVEGVLVMLYDNLDDSIIYKERPVYFSKTQQDGRFKIQYIRQDTFILRALKDENLNYLYDIPTELVGFYKSPILISPSYPIPPLIIEAFQKATPIGLTATIDDTYGLLKVAFNQPGKSATIRSIDPIEGFQSYHFQDSIFTWYLDFPDSVARFEVVNGEFIDTIMIGPYTEDEKAIRPTFRYAGSNTTSRSSRTPGAPVSLKWSNPIASIDTSKISIVEDSVPVLTEFISLDTLDPRNVLLTNTWKEDTQYQILGLPGAFTDIYQQVSPDTFQLQFKNGEVKNFGNIILTMNDLDTSRQYIIRLMDQEKLVESSIIIGDTSWTKTYSLLPPRTYKVELIKDLNQNGEWDTGDYDNLIQPEPILISELESLRAGWDVTAEIKTK